MLALCSDFWNKDKWTDSFKGECILHFTIYSTIRENLGGGIIIYLYTFSSTSIGTSHAIGGKTHFRAEQRGPWMSTESALDFRQTKESVSIQKPLNSGAIG